MGLAIRSCGLSTAGIGRGAAGRNPSRAALFASEAAAGGGGMIEAKTSATRAIFAEAIARFDPERPVLILTHNDADGLSAGCLLARALRRAGRAADVRIVGRGEGVWSEAMRAELSGRSIGGLIVADLGSRSEDVLPGVPTIVIDHHVPVDSAGSATVISGYGEDPIPTSSLLAFRCAGALADASDLLWLAAVGLIGDLGDKAPFADLAAAKKEQTGTALREVVSLVNAPRRTASGDAAPAFALLMTATGAKDALARSEAAALRAAREEVKAAVEAAKKVGPRVGTDVALVLLDTPCQIHPLIAQTWRTRLGDKVVIAANTGYRPGFVHFAARSATGRNLIAFLREVAPPNVDDTYGNGHEQATGGALPLASWPVFLRNIGFDADGRPLARKAAA